MRRVIAATGNAHKITELRALFAAFDVEVVSKRDAGVAAPDPEETGLTFEENALLKARAVFDVCGEMTIADDSGLEVDALRGAPGIYSARFAERYAEKSGLDGYGDAANNALLLKLLAGIPAEQRTARFVCAIACIGPGREPLTVRGVCEGYIAQGPAGREGFGYDPLFIPREYAAEGRTFAQLPETGKNAISHRGRALALLAESLSREAGWERVG
ncbi:MAG: RdgB/HAM1 family non-canonical purine NTP pyrophosphatase [Clostridiales Family XIII bacterium]|jgi:XTP/dITP diphosphohydrolase|nr:RdgB/HAM1 family non-canonical purine NTP pyrophosphatase [Clostridiales Family XIII bacterium]